MILEVRYQVLGPLEAHTDAGPASLGGPKQRLVLAILLIRTGHVVSDDRLVDELWPHDAPDGARHAIQTYVSELRRVLEDEIRREGGGYRLVTVPESVDALRFQTLVEAARARAADAPAGAAALSREALELWHGEPYGGVADSPMLRAEIHRLTELRLAAVEDRLAADLDAGSHLAVATELEALTREHPYRERLHALHMLALYRADRQADALRAYHRARRWLVEQMGVDPSPALQSLEHRILTQDPELDPRRPPSGLAADGRDAPSMTGGPVVVRGLELREKVGEGDLGATYRAYQASIGREVAVKVMRAEVVRHPTFMGSFELRARRIAALDHPNLLPMLDWWREPDGAYVVTPWIRGGSLHGAFQQGPWSLSATLRMLDQVGGALAAAHRAALVHGELRPESVLLDADRNALLTGFPVTERPREAIGAVHSATAAAIAPEARRGEPITPRSDVWSLGVLAIEALCGMRPDAVNPTMTLGQHRNDLPADLVAVLAQATSPVPSDRHERIPDLLRDLRRAVGADVVALPASEEVSDRIRNPYKGLQAFSEVDARDFFGRDALIERMVDALGQHRLMVVAGPSGCGKSSVVRAGLVPALRANGIPGSREWLIAEMFPGAYPFEALETALLGVAVERPDQLHSELSDGPNGLLSALDRVLPPAGELLLVIDQLEELWSLTDEPDARRRFLSALVTAVEDPSSRLRIVATLRADFLDRVLEHQALGELTRRGLVLVVAPSVDELTQAVVRPARGVGLEFEPGLVDGIVRDVADQPGALPLLQHALAELVGRRDGRRLTAAAYRATGGVIGALGRRAEQLYGSLSSTAGALARQIFLRLVAVDEQSEDARRRVRRAELGSLNADPALIDDVLLQFGAHRLLSFDRDPLTRGPTVEVAHEALFREWDRLGGWIDSRREDLLRHRRLRTATGDWLAANRSPEYLFSGARLDELERWAAETDLGLTEDERRFLAASRDRENAGAARRRRLRRALLLSAGGAAMVAIGLASFAFLQLGRAEAGEREARARALAAASRTQLEVDQDLALLLAIEAVGLVEPDKGAPIIEAVNALHAATIAHRTVVSADVGGFFVAFAGEDAMFSTGPPRLQPMTWDPTTGAALRLLDAGGTQPTAAAVSADGLLAAETYQDAATVVWNLASGEAIARLGRAGTIGFAPSFSPDGQLLAVASVDPGRDRQMVVVFEVAAGRELGSFETAPISDIAFGPDGDWLAVADDSAAIVRLHEPMTGEVLATLGDPAAATGVASIALDPHGERLAMYTHGPSRIQVVDIASERTLQTIAVGPEPGRVCFASTGRIIGTAADELVHVWDVASSAEVLTLPGSAQVNGLACAPDGRRVAVTAEGGFARIFDLDAAAAGEVASFPVEPPANGRWSPDGSIFVAHDTETVRRYDSSSGRLDAEQTGLEDGSEFWIALSADGSLLAASMASSSASGGSEIALLEAATLRSIRAMDGAGLPLAFSRDGRLLLAGGRDGAAVFDVATGARLLDLRSPLNERGFDAPAGLFLADGAHVLVKPAARPETWIYELESGTHVGTVCSGDDSIRVALDPAGEILAVADYPGSIELWRVDDLLRMPADASPTCSRTPPNASDSARIMGFSASGAGGIRFSPDGTFLAATSGFDGTLGVWSVGSGEPVLAIEHEGTVSLLGFSPDGRHLAAGLFEPRGSLHAIRLYALDASELAALARAKLTRDFSDEECRTYLQETRCPTR